MFDAQRTKRPENDKSSAEPAQNSSRMEPRTQHTGDLTRIPLYTQLAWGNQPPPWLRLPVQRQVAHEEEPLQERDEPLTQRKENTTGLPDTLKAGVEDLSGLSMDDVQVTYHSSKPAEVQALAYTQGTEIHVGPGQERHLAHEAWHVVQQKQGRVKSTLRSVGIAINDDRTLESEADTMGAKAKQAYPDGGLGRMRERAELQRQASSGIGWVHTQQEAPSASQAVVQLMKLSELQQLPPGFTYQYHQSQVAYKLLQLGGEYAQYHVTIFPNDTTYNKFPDVRKPPPQRGTLDVRNLPSDDEFEFDELHITGEQRSHFFYNANGEPLLGPLSKYAGGGYSVEWKDDRWYVTNRIIANLRGETEDEINKKWDAIVLPLLAPPPEEQIVKKRKEPPLPKKSVELPPEVKEQIRRSQEQSKQRPPAKRLSVGKTASGPIKFNLPAFQSPSIEIPKPSESVEPTVPIETISTQQTLSEEIPQEEEVQKKRA